MRIRRISSLLALALSLQASTAEAKDRSLVAVVDGGLGSVGTPVNLGRDRAFVSGYVVANRGFSTPSRNDSKLRNIARNIRAARAAPAADVQVDVNIAGREFRATTDAFGRFEIELDQRQIRELGQGTHSVDASVPGQAHPEHARGELHLFRYDQDVVISDIDDTVVRTRAHEKVKMAIRYMTSDSPHVELVQPSASRFYRGLSAREVGLVFVTSRLSGWMPRTRREARRTGLPSAPILSKTRGSDSFKEHGDYKLRQIERVQSYLPNASLHLIGDSGEADPEVFAEARGRWGNIVGAHIRQVRGAERKTLPDGVRGFSDFKALDIGQRREVDRQAQGRRGLWGRSKQIGRRVRQFTDARRQVRSARKSAQKTARRR